MYFLAGVLPTILFVRIKMTVKKRVWQKKKKSSQDNGQLLNFLISCELQHAKAIYFCEAVHREKFLNISYMSWKLLVML